MSWKKFPEIKPEKKGRYLVLLKRENWPKYRSDCFNFDPGTRPHWDLSYHPLKSLKYWRELPELPLEEK